MGKITTKSLFLSSDFRINFELKVKFWICCYLYRVQDWHTVVFLHIIHNSLLHCIDVPSSLSDTKCKKIQVWAENWAENWSENWAEKHITNQLYSTVCKAEE